MPIHSPDETNVREKPTNVYSTYLRRLYEGRASIRVVYTWLQRARQLTQPLVDFVYPPQCPLCHARVLTHNTFCVSCWLHLDFIHDPFCARCALPLPYAVEGVTIQQCLSCLSGAPVLKYTRAVWGYNPSIARLIIAFKNHDASHLLPLFARFLEGVSRDVLAETDMLVPVPLARAKLFSRFFNQSAELARALAGQTGVPFLAGVLARHAARDQKTLGFAARQTNVQGVYFIQDAAAIQGKRVTLVDDVYTTGATLEACAKVLKAAGAAEVNALVLARTIRTEAQ